MSWAYWGIVIGLAAAVVMLMACTRMLSANGNESQQGSRQSADGSSDTHPEAPIITRRAA